MKKSKKLSFLLITLFCFLTIFVYKKWPDSSIKIVFCDVGQGDSILIQQDFFQVLIDSGRDDRVLGCLSRALPAWDRRLEVLILTHGDEDHVGFFVEIMGFYSTDYLFFPETDKNTTTLTGLKEAIEQELGQGARWKQPILGQSIGLPLGGTITFLESQTGDDPGLTENDRSIVFLLEYGQTKWLFTGDLELKGEIVLLERGLLPTVDVLKVGHHGSKTSSSLDFLEKVRPTWSIISAGAGNRYGHPAQEVLDSLAKIDSVVLRTDQLGDLTLTTDGEQIWLKEARKRPE